MRFQRVEEWIVNAESEAQVEERFGKTATIKDIGAYFPTPGGPIMRIFEVQVLRDIHPDAVAMEFPTAEVPTCRS